MFLRGGGTRTDRPASPSRLILITGGVKSGKSDFALRWAERKSYRQRLFVATAVACDEEMRRRIALHRKSRNGQWQTLEEPIRLPERLTPRFLRPQSVILIDCLPTFVTNLILKKLSHSQIHHRIKRLLEVIRSSGATTLFVTNEVGWGLVPDSPLGRQFRDLLGAVNQQVATRADEVYLLVAGLPMRLK